MQSSGNSSSERVAIPITSRGALLLTFSQAVAIFVGFAIHVGLTRFLSPEFYGLYAVTISVLMWGELLITGSVGTAFAKTVSEGSVSAKQLWLWTWQSYLPLWIALWLILSASSWLIASWLRDARLVVLLLVAFSELPFFGIYIAGRSLLQGLMAYGWTTVVSSMWALLRLVIIFALVLTTKSVLGALVGNTVAVAITALISIAVLRPFLKKNSTPQDCTSNPALRTFCGSGGFSRERKIPSGLKPLLQKISACRRTRLWRAKFFGQAGARPSEEIRNSFGSSGAEPSEEHRNRFGSAGASPSQSSPTAVLVGVGLPTLTITLLDQIVLAMDLWLLKRMAEPELAGYYGAARFFALALLMLTGGLGSAWFPAMCHELGKGEREKAKALFREAMRVLILGLLPFAVVTWTTAKPLSVLLFSSSFEPTSEPMRWLVIATSLFTFMGFIRGALIADNEFRIPVILAFAMAILDFLLCKLLIPTYGMVGAAWATTVTSASGLILMWVFAVSRFGDFMPITTLVRAIVASFALWLISVFWVASGLMLLVQYLLLGTVYILLLIALGEIKRSDCEVLKVAMGSIFADAGSVLRLKR